MATVELTEAALQQIRDLPRGMQSRVWAVVARLEAWPSVSGAKPLRGLLWGYYRVRTGDSITAYSSASAAVSSRSRKSAIAPASMTTDKNAPPRAKATRGHNKPRSLDGFAPAFPARNERGNYPALAAVAVSIARGIVAERLDVGLTQAELAKLAHVRLSTLERIETSRGRMDPRVIDKVDDALKRAAARRRSSRATVHKRRTA